VGGGGFLPSKEGGVGDVLVSRVCVCCSHARALLDSLKRDCLSRLEGLPLSREGRQRGWVMC